MDEAERNHRLNAWAAKIAELESLEVAQANKGRTLPLPKGVPERVLAEWRAIRDHASETGRRKT